MTLSEYVAARPRPAGAPASDVLIFDQFEEILTLDPTDLEAKRAFFAQVGQLLRNEERWALFSLREDHIAALDPFLPAIPTRLATPFRLDLLGPDAARLAMQQPALNAGASFADDAAQRLVDDLRRVRLQQPDGSTQERLGPHIEPVQLQVVCQRLWDHLDESSGRIDVPLVDNVFVVDLARARLPARLVAYDDNDRVIDVSRPVHDFDRGGAAPARGRAELLLKVTGPDGAHAELFVGPATQGGECMYVKQYVDQQHAGRTDHCRVSEWTGPPVQVTSSFDRFVVGRVRDDVATVRVRFADGSATDLEPTRGYVLYALPAERLGDGQRPVAVEGLDRAGKKVGEMSLLPPSRRR